MSVHDDHLCQLYYRFGLVVASHRVLTRQQVMQASSIITEAVFTRQTWIRTYNGISFTLVEGYHQSIRLVNHEPSGGDRVTKPVSQRVALTVPMV